MESRGKDLGILVGGGPAPGINGIIGAVTIEARNRGLRVWGIYDGWQWLIREDARALRERGYVRELQIAEVSRIHFDGGSLLRTSRANPTRREEDLDRVVSNLRELGIGYLVTVGGDDTAFAAARVCERARGTIRFAHVPKTIDNDLPLPGGAPTFGFNTAKQVGFELVRNLMEDSRTTNRWFFVSVMGRSAGHLALGIGKAAGATLTLIPEEFPERTSLALVADALEAAMLKRRVMGREDGVAIVAEGILERVPEEELAAQEGVRIVRDPYGHIRLAELDLAYILKSMVERRFAARGEQVTIVHKSIGYELRCAPPIASDSEYVRDLGYGAVRYLLEEAGSQGAMVCMEAGQLRYVDFTELLDPQTGRTRVRRVDLRSTAYRVARKYMIRLEPEDLADPQMLRQLSAAAGMAPQAFRARYEPAARLGSLTTGT
ncbi:MAG: diphosphate--fructose-6-phosphate 1-phosphotransferase [Armatimonadota bacterium]|nr:diphosphate--fructose-6-phosphate 1-phosphotransferase [Armatimonadota bacterium]MDR7438420.1 diphosphate--fructose-6-phosphate 1-phosphotransferase [Armatimonadota bacterium]MDR7562219.1 diphosphate--fructose-6-phosphate 1-phosphotransferase [Armatimonadota bacterium]MDR7567750.1 diphosphate--fructose-6-phosphate 1-phosphotransferase [Armatimonadota bacterium]MDR7601264.1 diphosphate--fructose-6-phosphate 1-phosphotransferase [Armatimonadota bacterium]